MAIAGEPLFYAILRRGITTFGGAICSARGAKSKGQGGGSSLKLRYPPTAPIGGVMTQPDHQHECNMGYIGSQENIVVRDKLDEAIHQSEERGLSGV